MSLCVFVCVSSDCVVDNYVPRQSAAHRQNDVRVCATEVSCRTQHVRTAQNVPHNIVSSGVGLGKYALQCLPGFLYKTCKRYLVKCKFLEGNYC